MPNDGTQHRYLRVVARATFEEWSAQLADLPFVDRRLEAEIELPEGLIYVR